jgi:malate synthase
MEDAATAEIARVQLWQWAHHGARLDTGEIITVEYVDRLIKEIAPTIKRLVAGVKDSDVQIAVGYLKGQVRRTWPSEFLTSDLMPYLAARDGVEGKWQKSAL